MAVRAVAVIILVVGLYLNLWHSNPLPFNHFQVFGRDFGSQHWIHSMIGLAFIITAVWLWVQANKRVEAIDTSPVDAPSSPAVRA